jgi:hypothetical protein
MNNANNPEIIRERVPVIDFQSENYEIRADTYYGISHYASAKAKSKKSILKKFKKILKHSKGRFVIIKPIAIGHSKTVIKNYEQLPKRHYAVFTQKRDGIQYHGVTIGVDRSDALKQIANLNTYPYWIDYRDITLLIIENNKIKRDIFADKKVEDLTSTNKSVFTPLKTPYFRIKGNPVEAKEKEPVIVESELY